MKLSTIIRQFVVAEISLWLFHGHSIYDIHKYSREEICNNVRRTVDMHTDEVRETIRNTVEREIMKIVEKQN